MTKAEKAGVATVEDVLASMTPGERYTVNDIARRLKVTVPTAKVLVNGCVARRKVSVALVRSRNLYLLATAEELAAQVRADLPGWPREVLQGYDAANRRFQSLCLATRKSVLKI